MTEGRASRYLTNASNLAIVIAAIVIVAATYLPRRVVSNTRTGVPASGDKLRGISGVSYADANVTAVLFLRSGCQYCNDSMGFYRRLAASVHDQRRQRRIIALTTADDAASLRSHLDANGVRVDSVRVEQSLRFGVTGTPTLILVNNAGVVIRSFSGRLNPSDEEEVFRLFRES